MSLHDILLLQGGEPDALPPLVPALLAWYDRQARSLPWRDDPTPYRVWISEIMLQQTRVEAVRGYFARFVDALPDIPSLAQVPEEKLLKLWEGLGYYNRARNLHRAAKLLVHEYGSRLPASYAQLLELPGFGEYTAGAVASIAFGIPVPAVDGNVLRVLSRLLASEADISQLKVKRAFRQVAIHMLPHDRPGDFNQSMMELGATVCVPGTAPRCGECPVQGGCAGYAQSVAGCLPVKAAKKQRRIEHRTILIVLAADKTLLLRREAKGLLPGMYEPVNVQAVLGEQEAEAWLHGLGAQVGEVLPLGQTKHIFSHVEWHMTGYLCRCGMFEPPQNAVWADADALREQHALPSAFRSFTKNLPQWLSQQALL